MRKTITQINNLNFEIIPIELLRKILGYCGNGVLTTLLFVSTLFNSKIKDYTFLKTYSKVIKKSPISSSNSPPSFKNTGFLTLKMHDIYKAMNCILAPKRLNTVFNAYPNEVQVRKVNKNPKERLKRKELIKKNKEISSSLLDEIENIILEGKKENLFLQNKRVFDKGGDYYLLVRDPLLADSIVLISSHLNHENMVLDNKEKSLKKSKENIKKTRLSLKKVEEEYELNPNNEDLKSKKSIYEMKVVTQQKLVNDAENEINERKSSLREFLFREIEVLKNLFISCK